MASPLLFAAAVAVLILLVVIRMPVSFALLGASMTYIIFAPGLDLLAVSEQLTNGLQTFSFVAIIFFILAGELLSGAGMTTRLVDFANLFVGRIRGGLAHVNVVTSMLFAGISGAAVADTSAIGSILIPAMEEDGYSSSFSGAVTASSSVIGPIIPPSIIMVVYATTVPTTSVGALFAAGILPGILLGLSLIGLSYVISLKEGYGAQDVSYSLREGYTRTKDAALAMLTPVIIIGGVLGGVFTPTEAGAIASVYAYLIGRFYYQSLTLDTLVQSIQNTAVLSADILLIAGASQSMSFIVAVEKIPSLALETMTAFTSNQVLLFLIIAGILFIMGMIMEPIANILVWAPVFAPIALEFGIEPLHFAMWMVLNVMIGLITPPIGLTLFVASSIGGASFEGIVKTIVPFLIVEVFILMLVIFIPEISLTIPEMLGY